MRLYDCLANTDRTPQLAINGGISEGSLGLNGIIAKMRGITTMGFIPRQGLASVGTRDHMVVWGDTYADREVLVGTVPDIPVCVGGAGGTLRECEAALKRGSAVLVRAHDNYDEEPLLQTFRDYQNTTNDAQGSMKVCKSDDNIPEGMTKLLAIGHKHHRAARAAAVNEFLTEPSQNP